MYKLSPLARSVRLSNNHRALLCAAAAVCLLACNSASAGVNLVSNGSFETGDFNGWQHTYPVNQSNPGVVVYDPNATASEPTNGLSPDAPGSYLAEFVGDQDNETLEQKVWLLPGNYTAGFSAYPFSYQNPAQEKFSLYVGNTLVTSIDSNSVAANQWYLVSGTFSIATAGWYNVKLKYKSYNGIGRDMLIDLAYVICTPNTTC